MRRRLFVVFLIPMTIILVALGGAYGWSAARTIQQQVSSQLLSDLSYFSTGASQALRAGDPAMIETELRRYGGLYDAQVVVYDRSGTVWAASERTPRLSDGAAEQVALALSGRRGELSIEPFPLAASETVAVEPVFDDGSVIGAVRIAASTEAPRRAILTQWGALAGASLIVIAGLVWAVYRLASWVLKPLRRLDSAMAAIEHGEMGARIDDDTGPPEVRRMVRMFNQMADEIERVMTRQQEFVMNASHELRNPLGALLMRVEYLATGLDEGWIDDVEHAREEGRRMTRILDTLLNVARDGKSDSAFVAVDLGALVSERAAGWRDLAADAWVVFHTRSTPHVFAVTDRMAVETALDAIIDNALKFAPRGSIIDLAVTTGEGAHVISVRDRGRGLEPEQLEQATDRFWRSPQDQNVPGSGLGLAIASDLLDAVGGTVELSLPAGGGLCVSLVLPATESLGRGDGVRGALDVSDSGQPTPGEAL